MYIICEAGAHRTYPFWSRTISVALDELYSPSPIQTPRKPAHLNLRPLVLQASIADTMNMLVITVS